MLLLDSIGFLSKATLLTMLIKEVLMLILVDFMSFYSFCALEFGRGTTMPASRIDDYQLHRLFLADFISFQDEQVLQLMQVEYQLRVPGEVLLSFNYVI